MGSYPLRAAVAILNYNGLNYLREFLSDVVKYVPESTEVVLIDNASTDGSVEWVQAKFPGIRIIRLAENFGFAGGYNKGLEEVEANYFILLNSDVQVREDWLSPLLDWMDDRTEVAACQPKVLSQKEPGKFEHAGAAGGWLDIFGYPFCRGRILGTIEQDLGQYDSVEEIFWATGAALVIRSSVWREFEGFDEDFFAHMEEIDLCYRIKRAGYAIYALPFSKIYHVGGGTLPYSSPRKIFLNFRNSLFLLLKNKRKRSLFFILPARLILDGIAALFFLVQGKPDYFHEVFLAHISFYKNAVRIYEKRKKLSHLKYKQMNKQGIYRGSIVVQYYLFGRTHFFSLLSGWKTRI